MVMDAKMLILPNSFRNICKDPEIKNKIITYQTNIMTCEK